MTNIELVGSKEDNREAKTTPIDGTFFVAEGYKFTLTQGAVDITTVVNKDGYLIRIDIVRAHGHIFVRHEGKWYLVPSSSLFMDMHPCDRIHNKATIGPFDTVQEPLTIYVYLSAEAP